jgi:hypothetical protein
MRSAVNRGGRRQAAWKQQLEEIWEAQEQFQELLQVVAGESGGGVLFVVSEGGKSWTLQPGNRIGTDWS